MRRVVLVALIPILFGQNPPPPAPDEQEAPARFKTSVDLVPVPVVVRDREGRAVGGLRAENFEISDNGKVQRIARFSVEAQDAPAASESGKSARPALPPSVVPTRFFAFLIDDLHLESANFQRVVAATGGHLRALLPGDRAAVLSTSGRIATEFTNDQDKLRAALAKIAPLARRPANTCPNVSYHEADMIVNRGDQIAMDAAVLEVNACMPELSRSRDSAERVVTSAARAVLSMGDQDTRVAVSALLYAIRRLEVMAGQRDLVVVSPGLLKSGMQSDVSHSIQRAIQAGVTINAIDARGLWADSAVPEDGVVLSLEAERTKGSLATEAKGLAGDVMAEIAGGSGGRLFQNGNAPDLAFQQAAAIPEYQYTLSFAPQRLNPDGKYHELKVTLKGARGLTVEARKGYFAPRRDPDPAKQAKQEIQAEVLSRGERSDLTVDAATSVLEDPVKGATDPKYVLAVFTRLDLKALEFRRINGRYSNEIRNVAALFDSNGNLVAGKEQAVPLDFGAKELEKYRQEGLILRTDFDLKPGAYLLRVVSRESEGQRLGSRNLAITVPAEEGGAQPPDAFSASLARAKKKAAPAWNLSQAPPPEPEEPEEPLSPNLDMVKVPGGLAALARMLNLPSVPSPDKFFLAYCREIVARSAPAQPGGGVTPVIPVAAYMSGVAEIYQLTEREPGRISLTLDAAKEREKTVRVLTLLGWTVRQSGESAPGAGSDGLDAGGRFTIEPGDSVADGSRQEAGAALGIDQIAMVNALAARQSYPIVVPSDEAQFIQAQLWTKLAGPLPPGGFAELFARRPAFAKAYAGLAAMNFDAANASISAVGLRSLVENYASIVGLFGASFEASGGRVAVPGGPEADAVWEHLAGASPRNPKAFFRALLRKDSGRLAEFYFAVWRADRAHQRFFTANRASAARFYAWFREEHIRVGVRAVWQEELLRDLPLDEAGRVRFPGGRIVWTSGNAPDGETLLGLASLRALVPVAQLEEARKAPLDAGSARLLSAHYAAWRALFPYFENLRSLGAAEFAALERLEEAVSKAPRPAQNSIMGQWHSLVKLSELASRAGSIDDAAAAQAFRRACEAFSQPDYSAAALGALRGMLGSSADPDEAVPAALLRLNEGQRAAFQQVKELQMVPTIASAPASPKKTLPALAGLIYAATLDPDSLLLVDDPDLLSRHEFTYSDKACGLFCQPKFSANAGSSRFVGGFAGFEAAARIASRERIRHAAGEAEIRRADVRAAPASGMRSDFEVSTRAVESYTTVTNGNGRYADGLRQSDFNVLDNRKPVPLTAFENDTSAVSVALLLDMSGSMSGAIASLRKSAFGLVSNLRPIDSVAVFGFSDSVSEIQPWTLDKDEAKRALLRTRVFDNTVLNDALLRLIHDLSKRKGKNAIVVFTDGDDTASALGADLVVRRAKENSVRIYTIAEGSALKDPGLAARLATIAAATGGLSFAISEASQMAAVFQTISQDLAHGYLLTIRPEPDPSRQWHSLEVVLTSPHGRAVRARKGYFGAP